MCVSLCQRTSQTLELCRKALQLFLSLLQLQLTERNTHTHTFCLLSQIDHDCKVHKYYHVCGFPCLSEGWVFYMH